MGRPAIKRFNKEFREYFDRLADSLQELSEKPRTKAMDEAARMLGVSEHAIKSWLRPKGGKSSFACPKWRADMFKLALPQEVSGLSKTERKQLADTLITIRENDLMDPQAAKVFDKIVGDMK